MAKTKQETIDLILEENKTLSGSVNSRCTKLSVRFRLSLPTLRSIIRDHSEVRASAKISEDERDGIRKAYAASCQDNQSKKIAEVSKAFGRSLDSVRNIIKAEADLKDNLFDYKRFWY